MQQRDLNAVAAALLDHRPNQQWWDSAACRGMNTDDFFNDDVPAAVRKACATCPVVRDCLAAEIGMEPADLHGYRGALDARTRRLVIDAANRLAISQGDDRARRAAASVAAGVSVTDVAVAFGVSRRTVYRWTAAA